MNAVLHSAPQAPTTRALRLLNAGSDAAVVLVDVTKLGWQARPESGPTALLAQTRRHALLAASNRTSGSLLVEGLA